MDEHGLKRSNDARGAIARSFIAISLNGLCQGMDNVFIERFYQTCKYHSRHLHSFDRGTELP